MKLAKRSHFASSSGQQNPPHPHKNRPAIKIGYARVSTVDQNLDLQLRALKEAGCTQIFSDKASGAKASRAGLKRALSRCDPGDMLVVWKLDRLGRSLIDLMALVENLRSRDIGLRVLTGQGAMIDTSKADGRMILGLFAVLAEFERELIRERTMAGMVAAKARGVRLGWPIKLSHKQIRTAQGWLDRREKTLAQIAAYYGVHETTLRRAMKTSATKT